MQHHIQRAVTNGEPGITEIPRQSAIRVKKENKYDACPHRRKVATKKSVIIHFAMVE